MCVCLCCRPTYSKSPVETCSCVTNVSPKPTQTLSTVMDVLCLRFAPRCVEQTQQHVCSCLSSWWGRVVGLGGLHWAGRSLVRSPKQKLPLGYFKSQLCSLRGVKGGKCSHRAHDYHQTVSLINRCKQKPVLVRNTIQSTCNLREKVTGSIRPTVSPSVCSLSGFNDRDLSTTLEEISCGNQYFLPRRDQVIQRTEEENIS